MKVLIITYYWPPAGGSGVQRWLKFVKYLRDFGIEPVVFTAENPNYPLLDDSLQKEIPNDIEVLKCPIWEPNNFLSLFKSNSSNPSAGFLDPSPSFSGRVLAYIRANYFIPDARKFWITPSVNYLTNYLKTNTIDAIITSGPPHSLHLIGQALKAQLAIKWIADFRDPWTSIDYFHQLPLTKKALQKHQYLEQEVLRNADTVLVVGETMKADFLPFNENIEVITNGFDEAMVTEEVVLDATFSITHIGLMNADRNPKALWNVLHEIAEENVAFKNDLVIRTIGRIADEVATDLARFEARNVERIEYLTHSKISAQQQKSQVLLLAINKVPAAKGIITGKIFEYLQAKRPILAIGPEEGDAAHILKTTQAGVIVDFEDESKLKSVILDLYGKFKSNTLNANLVDVSMYHRKALTKKLATVIAKTINI